MHSHSLPQHLLDEHAAALCLGLSVKTLRRWRWASRGLLFVKLGAAVRYAAADLDTFIDTGRRRSTSDQGCRP
ncbi:MAG TPA: helix-turn-helix domain-containing protein [Geminicoccaceae bacterium]|nr:helix-turn-helix domain-containing protein [Geminicoccus sp.]HMU53015.1 helix-turn-helix domain-containing protein [Geminicoccaceae bacterium]